MKSFILMERFLRMAETDERLSTVHVSLFAAICLYTASDELGVEFRITRRELMRVSKIRSKATYHRRLNELVSFGLISYQPSYDPFRASRVSIL